MKTNSPMSNKGLRSKTSTQKKNRRIQLTWLSMIVKILLMNSLLKNQSHTRASSRESQRKINKNS